MSVLKRVECVRRMKNVENHCSLYILHSKLQSESLLLQFIIFSLVELEEKGLLLR